MTGGHGALPYFNAFMNGFMKGKPIEKFGETPAMPADIKALAEQRKRDEIEKLEKAEEAGRKLGINFNAGPKTIKEVPSDTGGGDVTDPLIVTPGTTSPNDTTPTTPKPEEPKVLVRPPVDTPKKVEAPKEEKKPEGAKKKGKKGDDDN
jgi:hypothetical protein